MSYTIEELNGSMLIKFFAGTTLIDVRTPETIDAPVPENVAIRFCRAKFRPFIGIYGIARDELIDRGLLS